MSRAYNVEIESSVCTTISSKDSCEMPISLDEIVSAEEMKQILKEVLGRKGWEVNEDKATTEMEDGQALTWDLEKSSVHVETSIEVEKKENAKIQVRLDTDYGHKVKEDLKEKARKRHQEAFEKQAEKDQVEANKKTTEILDKGEDARKEKINDILAQVYGQALKRKAQKLGVITSITESDQGGDYSLTITISE